MRRPRPLPRWAGFAATAAVVLTLGPAPAAADLSGPCTATFNGVPVESIDSLSSPLELDHDAVLTFEGTDDQGTGAVRLELVLASIAIDEARGAGTPAGTPFAAALELEEVTPYGVGLYRIRGITDNCVAEAWLRITGRSPFATLAGLTAAGLALGGLLGQGAALVARRRSTPLVAALGGIATGFGGALLGQQFGRLQLSYLSLGIIVAGAVLAGALAGIPFMPRRARKPSERSEGRIPHPVAPSEEPAAEQPALRFVQTSEALAAEHSAVPGRSASVEPAEFSRAQLSAVAETATRPAPASESPAPAETPQQPDDAPEQPDGAPQEPGATPRRTPPAEPYWCYVMAPVEVFDLRDHTKVVITLTPGSWYLAKREAGGWAHVVTTAGEEGWVPRRSLHRQG
jgi:hypothetical protein